MGEREEVKAPQKGNVRDDAPGERQLSRHQASVGLDPVELLGTAGTTRGPIVNPASNEML